MPGRHLVCQCSCLAVLGLPAHESGPHHVPHRGRGPAARDSPCLLGPGLSLRCSDPANARSTFPVHHV
jgi:hypothetical protein